MSRAGESAFPLPSVGLPNGHWEYGTPGLSVREYFAAMAMSGSLGGEPGSHLIPENCARDSVAHADALIAELAKPAVTLPDGLRPYEALAEFLNSIGWRSPCDAQWTQLRDSLPKIAALASAREQP